MDLKSLVAALSSAAVAQEELKTALLEEREQGLRRVIDARREALRAKIGFNELAQKLSCCTKCAKVAAKILQNLDANSDKSK